MNTMKLFFNICYMFWYILIWLVVFSGQNIPDKKEHTKPLAQHDIREGGFLFYLF